MVKSFKSLYRVYWPYILVIAYMLIVGCVLVDTSDVSYVINYKNYLT